MKPETQTIICGAVTGIATVIGCEIADRIIPNAIQQGPAATLCFLAIALSLGMLAGGLAMRVLRHRSRK